MNRFFVFFSIIMMTFAISCRNVSDFNNEDAERNGWLTSFLQGKNIIEGKFNHSKNTIELFIEVNSIDNFYSRADSIAEAESWQSNKFDPNFRVYAKEMVTGGGVSEVYVLKMEFKSPNLLKINAY